MNIGIVPLLPVACPLIDERQFGELDLESEMGRDPEMWVAHPRGLPGQKIADGSGSWIRSRLEEKERESEKGTWWFWPFLSRPP